jgi:hypothetical protein
VGFCSQLACTPKYAYRILAWKGILQIASINSGHQTKTAMPQWGLKLFFWERRLKIKNDVF